MPKKPVCLKERFLLFALVKQLGGADCAAVVYPAVWMEFPDVPWEQKEQAFAMIGRIAPEKQVERAIEILEAVRQRGHAVRLHLCGRIGNDPYGRRIARLCRERADWIVAEGGVSGAMKARILAACRFGIQACAADAFGISVAEMVKAGAIVFTPNDGGQTEILGNPDLLFASVNDAADKICAVLGRQEKQRALRTHLATRPGMFSAGIFMEAACAQVKRASCNQSAVAGFRPRPKVVIGHPRLGYGGSESIVMWLIEALKRDYDVTVMTTGGWDLAALNGYYGTHVGENEVKVRIAPVPWPMRSLSAAALRGACFQRFARRLRRSTTSASAPTIPLTGACPRSTSSPISVGTRRFASGSTRPRRASSTGIPSLRRAYLRWPPLTEGRRGGTYCGTMW